MSKKFLSKLNSSRKYDFKSVRQLIALWAVIALFSIFMRLAIGQNSDVIIIAIFMSICGCLLDSPKNSRNIVYLTLNNIIFGDVRFDKKSKIQNTTGNFIHTSKM